MNLPSKVQGFSSSGPYAKERGKQAPHTKKCHFERSEKS
jgi:hypothetical protein